MKAVCATDLSAASEATVESETCLECLGRIGVDEIHLVTVIPSNVHAGMPGMDFEGRREKALSRYRRINGIALAIGASLTIVGFRGKSPRFTVLLALWGDYLLEIVEQWRTVPPHTSPA